MTFDSVTHYLSWDHDRLDAILADVRAKVADGELSAARDVYPAFEEGLSRHIRLEDDILFPLFERKTGIPQGPTTVMREEHLAILSALARMRAALAAGDRRTFEDALVTLDSTLPAHNDKEERILYPMTDDALSAAERAEVTARLVGG